MVNVGLIGCGMVGSGIHLPALKKVRNANVMALADVDEALLRKASSTYRIKNAYSDYQELIGNNEVDAVIIAAPPCLHAEMTLNVLDSGKHVFVEKPLAIQSGDARRLRARLNNHNPKTMIGFNYRFNGLYRELRQLLEEQAIGNVSFVKSLFSSKWVSREKEPSWKFNRVTGGGVLFDLATHHIDLFRYLFNDEITEVFAKTSSVQREEDNATLMFQMGKDISIQSFFSSSSIDEDRIEIYGDKGKLLVDRFHSLTVEIDLEKRKQGKRFKRLRYMMNNLKSLYLIRDDILTAGREHSYQRAFEYFINCIRDDKKPSPGLLDGIKNIEVLEAARQSAQTGMAIKLTQLCSQTVQNQERKDEREQSA